MPTQGISIRVIHNAWHDIYGDATRLISAISINETLLHLEAIRVHDVGEARVQEALAERDAQDFNLLCQYTSDGRFQTTEINGQQYVLIATPFT